MFVYVLTFGIIVVVLIAETTYRLYKQHQSILLLSINILFSGASGFSGCTHCRMCVYWVVYGRSGHIPPHALSTSRNAEKKRTFFIDEKSL